MKAILFLALLLKETRAGSIVSPFLNSCSNFAVMCGTAVSFNGAQTILQDGNVGVSPGTSISGSFSAVSGSVEANTSAAVSCQADLMVAYASAKNANCTTVLQSSDLAGLTLFPGVYCSASGTFAMTASTLTLDDLGDFTAA